MGDLVHFKIQYILLEPKAMNEPNARGGTEDFEFESLAAAVNYRKAIVGEFKAYLRGRVLEVGAGIGQISEAVLELSGVDDLVALEPDGRFHAVFKQRLPNTSLIEGTTNDLNEDEVFDSTIMINVLEHIEDDQTELRRISRILRPSGGHLCMLVPARPEIFSRLDAHFGHFRRYTKPELRRKLELAGFDVVSICYFNFIGYFAWLLRFKLMRKMSFDTEHVRFFDRRLFPLGHLFERNMTRPPFGQSLIAIAKSNKPA